MDDRELLELAARAAGYDVRWHDAWRCLVRAHPYNIDNPPTLAGQRMVWTPLTDDGDALRLAVKLGLCVTVFHSDHDVWVGYKIGKDGDNAIEGLGDDPYKATRRAIVRAAAKIAKDTP